MRFAFLLTTAVYAVVVAAAAWLLPERVPLHFGASGEPDRWGSRTEAVLGFGLLGLGLALLLGGSAALSSRLPLRSVWVNLPHKHWWTQTPQREVEARRRLGQDIYGMAAATMAFLCVLLLLVVRAARSDDPALGGPAYVLTGVFVVGTLAWSGWLTLRRYRPEEDG